MDAQALKWSSMKGYVGIVRITLEHGDDAEVKTNVRNLMMMMILMMMTIIIVVTIAIE